MFVFSHTDDQPPGKDNAINSEEHIPEANMDGPVIDYNRLVDTKAKEALTGVASESP